jgi:hypothetical protein
MKETNPDFCTGVQILISRMESNPEEFTKSDKWYWVMSKVVDAKRNPTHHANTLPELTTEEINALFDAYTPFMRKKFDDSVLREVLSSEEKELSYSVTSAPPTVLGNSHGGSYTLKNTGVISGTITANVNQHQAHINKHKMMLQTLGLKEKP